MHQLLVPLCVQPVITSLARIPRCVASRKYSRIPNIARTVDLDVIHKLNDGLVQFLVARCLLDQLGRGLVKLVGAPDASVRDGGHHVVPLEAGLVEGRDDVDEAVVLDLLLQGHDVVVGADEVVTLPVHRLELGQVPYPLRDGRFGEESSRASVIVERVGEIR